MDVMMYRKSGIGSFNIRSEHLVARDTHGRSGLHIALLKSRNYDHFSEVLDICWFPHAPRLYGWPSLLELEKFIWGSSEPDWYCPYLYHEEADTPVDLNLVKQLIDAGADMNAVDSFSNSCLHYAVENEDCCDAIPMLLSAGANLESVNCLGDTPLLIAVKVNNLKAVDTLIKHGANVNSCNKEEDTCLHLAGDDDMLCFLINSGCTISINCANECGCSPFLRAIDYCQVNTLIQMIQAGADVNFKHKAHIREYQCRSPATPLAVAVKRNCDEIVGILLKNGANANQPGPDYDRALFCAASFEPLRYHSSVDASVDEKCANILQMLIAYGADICGDVKAFKAVLERGNLRAVQLCINEFYRKGIRVPTSDPLIHLALLNKRDDVFQFIIESNFNKLDEIDENGYTALHKSIEMSKVNRAGLLLDYGADIHTVTKNGETILDTAVHRCAMDVVVFLLSRGSLSNSMINITDLDTRFFDILSQYSRRRYAVQKTVMHLALIESLGRFVGPHTLACIKVYFNSNRELYEKCKVEIELARKSVVHNHVTVYDILTRVDHRYVRNEDSIKELSCENLHKRFPIYGEVIRHRLVESQEALARVLGSVESLSRILKIDYESFHHIYENILSRLTPLDTLNLKQI